MYNLDIKLLSMLGVWLFSNSEKRKTVGVKIRKVVEINDIRLTMECKNRY